MLCGGWPGHKPEEFANRLQAALTPAGLEIEIVSSLDVLGDAAALAGYDVIIPNWTMGTLTPDQVRNLVAAVRGGVGLAGIHGGMGDAFRGQTDYEWMVGGHFVGHPHVGEYTVRVVDKGGPITQGLPSSFAYNSEQYYLLVDPVNEVLADSLYTYESRECVMPIAWTKAWGAGRVFYSSLGHDPKEFDEFPDSLTLATRGILWAAGLL